MTTQLVVNNDRSKPYHHGDLRQALINAACYQIESEGTEKLSLRALARDAGVSPTAPYRHFPTKNCLLAAIAAEGFVELGERLDEEISGVDGDCLDRLAACGHTYVNYAIENPTKFNLMFGDVLADFTPYDGLQQTANITFNKFMGQIKAAQEEGMIADAPFDEVAAYTWSSMHGIASLIINKSAKIGMQGELPASIVAVRYMRDNLEGLIQRVIKGLIEF